MANKNPIKKTDPATYASFSIAKEHQEKELSISTETTLNKDGWQLDITHTLRANGEDHYPEGPDIDHEVLGKIGDLNGKKMALVSNPSRIKNGGSDPPAKITYALTFYAGEDALESFSLTIDEDSPSLYTKITFKVS